ncbi:surfeit locus 1 family protein [Palleronia aestuarii]|uniref:SURF1-like protein n=1 Tax=Palleronia aestuarii TaxID=568105 RepID=A0A2W7N2Z3_9RHOB|nr:SURF1 family protein [Palleronia aestuarii]PZX14450.1 surfeit locus 1 family protein [Palleronia aestuarii]
MTRRPRPIRTLLLASLTLALTIGFVGLGWWQIERRAWKIDLIDRVESRIAASPTTPPGPQDWADLSREKAEYLRVAAEGQFLDPVALVQAVTERGGGYWVVSPFVTQGGMTILVNRGYIPSRTAEITPAEGEQRIVGLLRMTEPEGGFLRANDPDAGRWYSRDVAEIARSMGLDTVAPYFVDAEADANGGTPPVGGLTVVRFRNTHLVYALTWFTLAAMSLGATILVLRPARPGAREPRHAD